MNPKRYPFFLRTLCFFAGIACLQSVGVAQSSLTLNSTITSANPSITGNDVYLELAYACAGTTSDCDGSVLVVDIPVGINYVSLSNSAHIASSSYNSGTREVTFTFVDPLLAGSSGTVRVRCRFPLGDTPNNFVATFGSEISSTSTVPLSETSSTAVTAQAVAKPELTKTLAGSAATNTPATFKVEICNAEQYSARFGSLNFSNVRIEDVLPVGATYISGLSETSGVTSVFDAGSRTITTTVGALEYGDCIEVYYTVEYPTPTFSLGDVLTNTAEFFYTPVGASEASITDDVTFTLGNPTWSVALNKDLTTSGGTLRQGQFGSYRFDVRNAGSSVLSDFAFVDTIPAGIEVVSMLTGQWFDGPGVASTDLTVEYQTNLNSTWTAMPSHPISVSYSRRIDVSDLGLAPSERITMLRWRFASYTTAFDWVAPAYIDFRVDPTVVVGSVIDNCLAYTTSSGGANPSAEESCDLFTVTAAETQPVISPVFSNLTSGTRDLGENSRMIGRLRNEDITIAPLTEFWGACLMPKGFTYNPSNTFISYTGALSVKPAPTITVTDNYAGTEYSLLKFDWSATGATLDPSETISIDFYVSPNEYAAAGAGNIFKWYVGGAEATLCGSGFFDEADILDLNLNGNITERFCYSQRSITVAPRIEVQSELEVKGALDTDWTKFPANGETLPGGLADYQISVRNTGNVALEDVILLDILPSVGDLGVIDPQARLSEWSPNLAGPVNAPAGVTVEYSTATNPCRAADGFLASDPGGCQAPNWTALPPADITQVKSIRFLFGSTRIEPQTEFSFSWPMRTPVNVFSQPGVVTGDIAWNSYGIVANRADNGAAILPAEPVKTGIALNALIPGVIGDYVWIDADNDGIQDVGESGFDGTRVELYRDNGDGSADPAVDEFVDFTVTADGGYYLFPNLPTGDYFVWFVKPPTYNLVAANQGGDDGLDSDATAYTKDGISGAITDIISITDTDFEYSVDFGITPSGLGAIGNYAWIDRNADGVQNESVSDGANGVQVELLTTLGALVSTTYTTNNSFGNPGYYLFDNITPGGYRLRFSHTTSPSNTTLDVGDDSLDSDVNSGTGETANIFVLANTFLESVDCGFSGIGPEDCGNGVDDDLDGFIDCLDEECPNGNAATRVLGL